MSKQGEYIIKNCKGTRWTYKQEQKCGWKNVGKRIPQKTYEAVIRKANEYVGEALLNGHDFKMPFRLGTIYLRKRKNRVYLNENGNLVFIKPVSWSKTRKLWQEDEEARKDRIIIRTNDEYAYIFTLCNRRFKNSFYYKFRCNRALNSKKSEKTKDGSIVR